MRLKSLHIHGFKSFANKVDLDFHEGVTSIVGPNGCGKSNIVDAMRWVLGETSAKAIRGGEMSDVIFSGTDKRPPLGMAEVTLTLTGCREILDIEFDEVSIGRRVFRDGKSDYLINNNICRLKDIHNLLMDTGIGKSSYSIMEQGKIDMLLSSKPEDRRFVFEQAAGITKYKSQKTEAIRKLDYTEANLVRIRDIVSENERQIKSISQQAIKAKRYQNLCKIEKNLFLHFNYNKWSKLHKDISTLNKSINDYKIDQENLESSIEEHQAKVTLSRVEYKQIEDKTNKIQQDISNNKSSIENFKNKIENNKERAHEFNNFIKKNNSQIEILSSKLEEQILDKNSLEEKIKISSEIFNKKENQVSSNLLKIKEIQDDKDIIDSKIEELDKKRNYLSFKIINIEANIKSYNEQETLSSQKIKTLNEQEKNFHKNENEQLAQISETKKSLSEYFEQINGYKKVLKEIEKTRGEGKNSYLKMKEHFSNIQQIYTERSSRLKVLEQFYSDEEDSIKKIKNTLNKDSKFSGKIHKYIYDYLDVKDKFALSIESVLGAKLKAIMVSNKNVAKEIIKTLNESGLGKVLLTAQDNIKKNIKRTLNKLPDKAICWAIDVIKYDRSLSSIMHKIFNNVIICDNLDDALDVYESNPTLSVVTLNGDLITFDGFIKGGKSESDSGSSLSIKNEINSLRKVSTTLQKEISSRNKKSDFLSEKVNKLEVLLNKSQEKLQNKQRLVSELDKKIYLFEYEKSQITKKLKEIKYEREKLTIKNKSNKSQLNKDKKNIIDFKNDISEIEENIKIYKKEKIKLIETEKTFSEKLYNSKTEFEIEKNSKNNIDDKYNSINKTIKELKDSIESLKGENKNYKSKTDFSLSENEKFKDNISEILILQEDLKLKKESVEKNKTIYSKTIQENEDQLPSKRDKMKELLKLISKKEIKLAEFKLKKKNIEDLIKDKYQIDIEIFTPNQDLLIDTIKKYDPKDNIKISDNEVNWDKIKRILSELKKKINSIGSVNLQAIEEFNNLEEHYEVNAKHLEDLENSKQEILKIISKINKDSKKMFTNTFQEIRKNFKEMFKDLFGQKARSDLILIDESDPLESGIEIVAKPPGKKLQSINLLSGGERSMTAVALLFGIFMVKPSPFCVLDELDAPLDEANIRRFIKVLDRFIKNIQFIIVTHSKRTMSRADIMYGISMEEFGISKMVGVTFSKSGEEKGLKQADIGG